MRYNTGNFIGQFETILSVNKTRERDGRGAPFFVMQKRSKAMAHGAMIAALYVLLTYLQNFIFPNSASGAIQFRASEALCVLALFTPNAIWGLSVGCLLFNLSLAGALPLDPVCGTLATLLATWGMYTTRKLCILGIPLPALILPAFFNALIVGWELTVYIGYSYWFNFGCVALGELGVLFTLGLALYLGIRKRGLNRLF